MSGRRTRRNGSGNSKLMRSGTSCSSSRSSTPTIRASGSRRPSRNISDSPNQAGDAEEHRPALVRGHLGHAETEAGGDGHRQRLPQAPIRDAGEGSAGARCLEFGSPEPGSDWEVRAAYRAIRSKNPDMAPGLVASQAMQRSRPATPNCSGRRATTPTVTRGALRSPQPHPQPHPVAPAAGSAIGGTIPVKNPDTQKAMAQRWDELTSQGMDGEAAKQKVLEEFSGK
jgi:hypothetical protein